MKGSIAYRQLRAAAVYQGCDYVFHAGASCRHVWAGPMPTNGEPMVFIGRRRREMRRAVYGFRVGVRLKASDRIVAVCGNERCADVRHLHVIPAPKASTAA